MVKDHTSALINFGTFHNRSYIKSLNLSSKLNKDLVLADTTPSMVKDHTFLLFNFGTLPLDI